MALLIALLHFIEAGVSRCTGEHVRNVLRWCGTKGGEFEVESGIVCAELRRCSPNMKRGTCFLKAMCLVPMDEIPLVIPTGVVHHPR